MLFRHAIYDVLVLLHTFANCHYLSIKSNHSLAQSPYCDRGQRLTMNHIADSCPLTKFEGGRNLVHEADDDAVIWLESTATAALAK